MMANNYLANAPFKAVSVMVRYGDFENLEPSEFAIDRSKQCLNITVQVDGRELAALSVEAQAAKHRLILIEALCDVAANYDLPFEFLDAMRRHAI